MIISTLVWSTLIPSLRWYTLKQCLSSFEMAFLVDKFKILLVTMCKNSSIDIDFWQSSIGSRQQSRSQHNNAQTESHCRKGYWSHHRSRCRNSEINGYADRQSLKREKSFYAAKTLEFPNQTLYAKERYRKHKNCSFFLERNFGDFLILGFFNSW